MHKVHASILRTLRRREHARFSELMHPTGLESDNFKFYLRKLVNFGYVHKDMTGFYALTAQGKEFANNIDQVSLVEQKQPKLSMQLVVQRTDKEGASEYLVQERLRQPYLHYVGFISGPIRWGETAEEAARRELYKQTGLIATFNVCAMCRTRDYDATSSVLLEDKLFMIMRAEKVRGKLSNDWSGGINRWMNLEALSMQPKHYPFQEVIEAMGQGKLYWTQDLSYGPEDY